MKSEERRKKQEKDGFLLALCVPISVVINHFAEDSERDTDRQRD